MTCSPDGLPGDMLWLAMRGLLDFGGGVLLTSGQYALAGMTVDIYSIAIVLILILSLLHETTLRRCGVLMVGLVAQLITSVGELACWIRYGCPGALAHTCLVFGSFFGYTFKVVVAMAVVAYVYTDASVEPLQSLLTRRGPIVLIVSYFVDLLICLINPVCGLYYSVTDANTFQSGPLVGFYAFMMVMQSLALFAAVPRMRRQHGTGTALRLLIGGALILFALLTESSTMRLLTTPSMTLELLLLTVGVQLRLEKALVEARAEAAETHMRLLSGQIRPHFIFNSLNTIKALIPEDPVFAERTVQDFADYLRSHLDVMSSDQLIPFAEEMSHVRHYVSLETTCSERTIELVTDFSVEDFAVPPLTVQPLVENAIRHGLRNRKEGGTIVVRTRETDDAIMISVIDNGCGFVSGEDEPGSGNHVGIANVRERLERQCHGTLSIQSGSQGTTATITLPKESR